MQDNSTMNGNYYAALWYLVGCFIFVVQEKQNIFCLTQITKRALMGAEFEESIVHHIALI
jgi:hypothetical protein